MKIRKRPVSESDGLIMEMATRVRGHEPLRHARYPEHGTHINFGPVKHIGVRRGDMRDWFIRREPTGKEYLALVEFACRSL